MLIIYMDTIKWKIHDWVNLEDLNLHNYFKGSPIGRSSESDLDYFDELHDLHNDYPLGGQKMEVTEKLFLEYQLQIIKDFFLGKNKKFLPNLVKKNKKTLHYQNLEFYLNLWLQLKIIHRIFEFKQE